MPKKNMDSPTKSIKKTLPRLAWIVLLILCILILPINIYFASKLQHNREHENSAQIFSQVEQLIEKNEAALSHETQSFDDYCIEMAELAAYFSEKNPQVTSDIDYARRLAKKMDVDEIHFFDKTGTIYGGTHPEYYGYNFDSGPQMEFFKPLLEDTSLKLCQGITPNTAEGKEMQYAAVWTDDKSGIVQIGMNPERVLKVKEENSLENLVYNLPFDFQGHFHILDKDTNTIIASTLPQLSGRNLNDVKELKALISSDSDSHITFQGKRYCVYTKSYQNMILARTYLSSYVLSTVLISTVLTFLYILLIAVCVLGLVIWYADRKISQNLNQIINALKKGSSGNHESLQLNTGISEFDSLTHRINKLFESWDVDTSRWDEEVHRLKNESGRDALTGLYNRRGFHDLIEKLFSSPEQLKNGICIVIDADDLKTINDRYGHRTGDKYIQELGNVLSHMDPSHAECARLGGDEFAVLLYGYDTPEEVSLALEKLIQKRGSRFVSDDISDLLTLEFSMGYSSFPQEHTDYHILIRLADERMYEEKRARKNIT